MSIKSNNILLVGNGFDLAHGLRTSYNDFLFLMQNWNVFYIKYLEKENVKSQWYYDFSRTYNGIYDSLPEEEKQRIAKLLELSPQMNYDNIEKLGEIIKTNSWSQYYQKCGAEIDGWIDFEREMYPVLDLLSYICDRDCYFRNSRRISIDGKIANFLNIVDLLPQYVRADTNWIYILDKFWSSKYGVLKKKLLDSLKKELMKFIKALEIYIHEFVHSRTDVKILKQISDINPKYVISFNYTLTEKIYGISEDKVHHIHGAIREDMTTDSNNMVLGVNERENQNIDFIYFVKYFQRIQKNCGTQYKQFVEQTEVTEIGFMRNKPYDLYIYGHSLDITDEDILKYIIGDFNENREFELKPEQVIIYYYDQVDFENKVINLINLYGRTVVEENMENDNFHFVKTNDETI